SAPVAVQAIQNIAQGNPDPASRIHTGFGDRIGENECYERGVLTQWRAEKCAIRCDRYELPIQ
ncbi:MAG: hypothetical protein O7D35_07035, partial [Acidobacteria bacterium]|nr:hypothetical protein [Acidobacteriota bacterium]